MIPELKKKMASIQTFYENLTEEIKGTLTGIDNVKIKLQVEVREIGDLKTKAEETKIYVDSDDGDGSLTPIIVETVDELMANCKKYRESHKKIE